jgi:asparagine synthase (glutamine-hydrolysing)
MFAFALWDARAEVLFLARDPFGIKPLYYYFDPTTLLFASEMKALLEYSRLDKTLDVLALDGFFRSLAIPEPNSVFKKVKKVPPGHFLRIDNRGVKVERFWRPRFVPSAKNGQLTEVQLAQTLRDQLKETVRISLRSDVPVGLLLSGGVDSSSVAAFAARESARQLQTFSATFDETDFNEGEYGKLIAKKFNTRHHEIRVTKRLATNIAERLAASLDEPFADSSAIPTYAVCQLAAANVKTVLSGEGADELFGGYPWHVAKRPQGPVDDQTIAEHPTRVVFSLGERTQLYSRDWKRNLDAFSVYRKHKTTERLSTLNRFLLDDLNIYLPSDILFKSDRMSMMHSLEVRVPFLNRGFAEWALQLPPRLKVNGPIRKYLLKQAMRRLVPAVVLQRPKKGFSIPMDLWLWEKGKWRDMIYDVLFSKQTREREHFDMSLLETLQRQHERLEGLHGYKLWTVFIFEMWQRRFLDRR